MFLYLTGRCSVAAEKRKKCGSDWINKKQCENRGCCYDDSIFEADYCFQPPGLSPIVKLNGMQKGKVLDVGAEPPCIILCREEASPPPPSRIGVFGELLETFILYRPT